MSLVEALPTHTPYDGSSKLFNIGLKPLEPANWIEVDGHLLPYLAEKRRLYAQIPDRVFVEEDGNYDRFGYNVIENRWAYGIAPPGVRKITEAIRQSI